MELNPFKYSSHSSTPHRAVSTPRTIPPAKPSKRTRTHQASAQNPRPSHHSSLTHPPPLPPFCPPKCSLGHWVSPQRQSLEGEGQGQLEGGRGFQSQQIKSPVSICHSCHLPPSSLSPASWLLPVSLPADTDGLSSGVGQREAGDGWSASNPFSPGASLDPDVSP